MIILRVFVLTVLAAVIDGSDQERSLRAVRNYDARLPCGPGKIFLDGPDAYMLWLKDDEKFLYRFPNEDTWQKTLNPNNIYGTSCVDNHCYDDTSLFLPQVSDKDEGKYRCRVHYQASSSVDYVVVLKIVDPTGAPRIYSDSGKEITTPYVGPLTLGENITLICEVVVSQTPTTVLWLRNGVIIRRVSTDTHGMLRERVVITNARRDELDVLYQCMTSNADVTEPFTIGVVIKMYLPPLNVEIRLNNNYDFEVGQPRVVDCVVIGCVPTPTINWYLGDKLLKSTAHKELHDGNYTVSSLTLTASIHDNMHQISCRVHNAYLTVIYENNVTIHVGYRPRCLLTKQQTVGIVPGEAETITCLVESSPEPAQFSWVFPDSRILYTNAIRVRGRKNHYCSSLTWIPQNEDVGLLYCRAVNKYGEQRVPCAYALNPGGAPHTPNGDVTGDDDRKNIDCQKDRDGGRTPIASRVTRSPEDTVLQSLPAYSTNPTQLNADTDVISIDSKDTPKVTGLYWTEYILYGSIVAIILVFIATIVVYCWNPPDNEDNPPRLPHHIAENERRKELNATRPLTPKRRVKSRDRPIPCAPSSTALPSLPPPPLKSAMRPPLTCYVFLTPPPCPMPKSTKCLKCLLGFEPPTQTSVRPDSSKRSQLVKMELVPYAPAVRITMPGRGQYGERSGDVLRLENELH